MQPQEHQVYKSLNLTEVRGRTATVMMSKNKPSLKVIGRIPFMWVSKGVRSCAMSTFTRL